MPSKIFLPKNLNRILSVAIALVTLFLVGVLVKKFFWDRSPRYDYALAPNSKLSIDGIDWAKTDRTILLALGTDCKYCTESAQFYRRLIQGSANQPDIRFIALFPKKEIGAENYLKQLGIPVSEIRYVSLASLGITKVPTVAVLDRNGTVTDMWIAKLPPRVESEIMQRLHLQDSRSKADWLIDEKTLRSRMAGGEDLTLLDLRDRTTFDRGHLDKAINIPLDELQVRAINELSATGTVILYGDDETDTDLAYRILDEDGFTRILFLARDSSQRRELSPQIPG
jgi:rhodanese-related sulfurtransferase